MISKWRIESNAEKIKAIIVVAPQKSIKDVQHLTRKLAALGHFLSRSGDRCLPFFNTLKKVNDVQWNEESQKSFDQLKDYFFSAPLLMTCPSKDSRKRVMWIS